ncbi:MAG: SusC/RagA family TonB-linked outer membrane protein [Phocaeicola plebeius]
MSKRVKSVSMMIALMGAASMGAMYAEVLPSVDGVRSVQQSGTCTGVVKDATGETVIGASVVVKGTTNGTITGLDGDFSLSGVKKGDIIQISFVGYETQEIVFNGQPLNVTLKDDSQQLEEVVVTALGIKREKKALGYAMQEVKGDALVAARETNLANALSGKVSGVQIIRSSNGPAGSSKIQLRGSNSVTGTNQPLIVVDGVPLDNFTGADNNDYWNPSTDMGNGLSDINSEDIESMSVLKGASAAALYGSRAGNGVILITTKKGAKSEGLGITISGSVSVEDVFMKPKRQKIFGQGSEGIFNATSGSNWGPEISGQSYTDWNGKTQNMQYFDNVANFFNTGVNLTENVAFSQQFNKTSVYVSATRLDDFSKIPGAEYRRTNLMSRISSSFGKDDRWSIDAKIQYINSFAKNRPISGASSNNYFYTMYTMPISLDICEFKQAKNPEDGSMYWWQKGSGMNPYWAKDYNTNQDSRNRFLQNYSLKYRFTDWLNMELKAGSDMYFTESESKLYAGSPNSTTGRYSLGEEKFFENNFSFLVTAQKDRVIDKLGGTITFGGNIMERKSTGATNSVSELTVPDLFWLGNSSDSNRSVNQAYSHRKTNSLYGTVGINYDGWAFLDMTGRNDWSSTLSKQNRSFFYPSISASWVISDMVNNIGKGMPDWFTYAKARVSFAQVGNDLDPYQLYNVYGVGSVYETGGTSASVSGSTLYDENVRSELVSSWEAGAEIRFFNNRLGLDVAWYKSNAKRQLLNLPMNALSGYSSKKINAGNIQNTGIEIMLNATPIQTKSFTWDTQLNFSTNKNKIIELADGISEYNLGGYDNLKILAVAGGNYGEIWGTTYLRVTDESSPYYGKLLLNDAGLPQGDSQIKKIGDQQANCLVGWTNTFSYKNFTLSFLVDARFGGDIFSGSNRLLQANGTAACTVVNGKREKFVVDGVIANGDGSYSPNTIEVDPQSYWTAITGSTGNLGIGEANLYDATNIRLRNLSLNYTFPKKMLAKTPFQQVKMGVSCNNVWMIHSNLNGIDPESVFATNTNATGFENASSPTSRTFLFNVTFGF